MTGNETAFASFFLCFDQVLSLISWYVPFWGIDPELPPSGTRGMYSVFEEEAMGDMNFRAALPGTLASPRRAGNKAANVLLG
jgi:hypothetical protein